MTDASPIAPTGTKDQIEREALLPCPFCGGDAATWVQSPGNVGVCGCLDREKSCMIRPGIGFYVNDSSGREWAIQRWNRRAMPPAAHDEEEERLRGLEANTYAASKAAFNYLAAERDAIRAEKAKLEGLVETLAEALSAIDPAWKLDCELRANALAEYHKWKEGK